MKKKLHRIIIFLIFLIILIFILIFQLINKNIGSESKQRIISNIKNNYQEIENNISQYKKTEKDIFGQSAEGAHAIYYWENNDLRKNTITYYGENGQTTYEYYYKNKELSFVYEKTYEYNRPIYWNEAEAKINNDTEIFDMNKSKIMENKYYFYKDKLIMWIDNQNNEVTIKDNLFKEKELKILEDAKELIKDNNSNVE